MSNQITFAPDLKFKTMYNTKDFEKLWFLYKTEGVPRNISIEIFCMQNGIPYNAFSKWFKDTHKNIVPVAINGIPTSDHDDHTLDNNPATQQAASPLDNTDSLRFSVVITSSDGLEIKKELIDYASLKVLVEKLEAIC
jgi:hypothetical protein